MEIHLFFAETCASSWIAGHGFLAAADATGAQA